MRNGKYIIRLLLPAVCCAILLSACGGSRRASVRPASVVPVTETETEKKKEYFDEMPDIETPDSWNDGFKLQEAEEGRYSYLLGNDNEIAARTALAYLNYLEGKGYSTMDMSKQAGVEDVGLLYYLVRSGVYEGYYFYSAVKGYGYVLTIKWE